MTLTSPGTAASPCIISCVDHAGTVPPVSADLRTTGLIATSGANALTIGTGHASWYGLTFSAGSAANIASLNLGGSSALAHFFKSCTFKLNNSSTSSAINVGGSANISQVIVWDNCTVNFGAAGQSMGPQQGRFIWRNSGTPIAGTTPTALFNMSNRAGTISLEGLDLSALASGNTIVGSNLVASHQFLIKDCKLGASVTVAATPAGPGGPDTILIRSDSSGTNYRSERYSYLATQTVETTIVRTGGASDGTTSLAWKIVTTANSKWIMPFEVLPITIWNDSTSSLTLTVYGIWGGGAVPNNDDIWMDVVYLGASGSPLGSFATTTKADNLASGSALTSDSSTWGGSTTAFKMSATFTPGMKGPITIYVRAAKASTTFYIDPRPEISGVTVSKSFIQGPGVYVNELSAGGSTGVSRARAWMGA